MSPEDIVFAGEMMNMKSSRTLLAKYLSEKTGKVVTTRDLANINSNLKRQSVGINPKKAISKSKSKVGTSHPEDGAEKSKDSEAVKTRDLENINIKRKRQSVRINPKKVISSSKTKVGTSDPVYMGEAALPEDLAEKSKDSEAVTTQDLANVNTKRKRQSVRINLKKAISSSKTKVGTSDPVCMGETALPEDIAGKSKDSKAVTTRDLPNVNTKRKRQSV